MKTTIQWLEDYLNQKVLPCPDGNDYVYGMNVAHENLINYIIPALKEKEKEQIIEAFEQGIEFGFPTNGSNYFNKTYNQNK